MLTWRSRSACRLRWFRSSWRCSRGVASRLCAYASRERPLVGNRRRRLTPRRLRSWPREPPTRNGERAAFATYSLGSRASACRRRPCAASCTKRGLSRNTKRSTGVTNRSVGLNAPSRTRCGRATSSRSSCGAISASTSSASWTTTRATSCRGRWPTTRSRVWSSRRSSVALPSTASRARC